MPFSHESRLDRFAKPIDERFIPGGGGEEGEECSVRGEVQGRNKQWRWKIMNRIAYINTRRLLRHIVRFICMRQPRSRRAAGHTRDKRNAQTKHATRPRRVPPRTRLTFRVPSTFSSIRVASYRIRCTAKPPVCLDVPHTLFPRMLAAFRCN